MQRANLYKIKVAKDIESDSRDFITTFHHSAIEINNDVIKISPINGAAYTLPLWYYEEDYNSITFVGTLPTGRQFRLQQPKAEYTQLINTEQNVLGSFSIGSIDPSGWAMFFYLTDLTDFRNYELQIGGSREQIQKLISGTILAKIYGTPELFFDLSVRLLKMIEHNPGQIYEFEESDRIVQILKQNIYSFSHSEQLLILNL